MADTTRVVEYFYVETPHTPGIGAAMLSTLRDARVNLLALSGFPSGRRAQIDFVPEDAAAFRAAAKAAKWKLVGPKKAFLISGTDRPGAQPGEAAVPAHGGRRRAEQRERRHVGTGRHGGRPCALCSPAMRPDSGRA